MKKALMISAKANMIKQFNMENIQLLQNLGYEVTVVTDFEDPGTIPVAEAKNYYTRLKKMKITPINLPIQRSPIHIENLNAYRKLKSIIEMEKFDLIHCHSPVGGAIARLASRFARYKGAKVVYTAHGFHFFKGSSFASWLLFYPIEKILSHMTHILITLNTEDFNLAKKRFGSAEIKYVPGVGVDTSHIEDIKIDYEKKRGDLNIPNNAFLMTSVGELNNNKNHISVIESLSELADKTVHYVICGQGRLRDELIEVAKKLAVHDQVHFLGYRDDIYEILKASDIFIFPSKREGLSVSLMEAMAIGLPVIASDIRGNNDLITHNQGGFLVDMYNRNQVVEYLKLLIDDKKLCKEFSTYNKNKIEFFSLENVLDKMNEIYNEV